MLTAAKLVVLSTPKAEYESSLVFASSMPVVSAQLFFNGKAESTLVYVPNSLVPLSKMATLPPMLVLTIGSFLISSK